MTPSRFLDANVFIRHITGDHAEHSPAARALFEDIEHGRASAWTTDVAIAEVVYVLASKHLFQLDRSSIRDGLLPLINLSSVGLPGKSLYGRVFELYLAHPIDFPDAYHAALVESRGETELYSFDRAFDRILTLHRIPPQAPAPTNDDDAN